MEFRPPERDYIFNKLCCKFISLIIICIPIGNSRTEIQTHREKVVTHQGSELYVYDYHTDVSSFSLDGIDIKGITRIQLSKKIECGDSETQRDFNTKFINFKERHRNRDTHMDASIAYDIPGFVERIAVTSDGKIPYWMDSTWFFVATLFLMTWPYRWYFTYKTKKNHYNIEKRIFIRNQTSNFNGMNNANDPYPTAPPSTYPDFGMPQPSHNPYMMPLPPPPQPQFPQPSHNPYDMPSNVNAEMNPYPNHQPPSYYEATTTKY